MSSWTFKPPWWATIATLILVPSLCGLGVWQLQRGAAKVALQERYEQAQRAEPREVTAGSVAYPEQIERARARGRFDSGRQLLLDNQSHDGKPGYHVLTPLILPEAGVVIVDRGWIPRPAAGQLPDLRVSDDEIEVQGLWRTFIAPPMRLEVDNCAEQTWPRLVQFPTFADLRCLYGEFVADGLLLMDATVPNGYVREWQKGAELSPTKNYGYAAQWFAFALTLLGIFIKLNLRRSP